MRNLKFVLFLLFAVSILSSCVKDAPLDDKKGVAPELPPLESFVMPFNGFEDADTTGFNSGFAGERTSNTYTNWFYAATSITIWHAITSVTMVVPIASFAEAFNHEATYEGDGIWLWAYNYSADNSLYSAELRAEFIDNENVSWEMTISKAGSFQDVIWYTGVTPVDGTGSSWTLNHKPFNPEPFLQIEFSHDETNGFNSMRYTNIIPNNPDNGDYIEYKEVNDGSEDFNRSYDIFRMNEDNFLEAEWNAPTNEGRVKSPKFYNDAEWHCWDESAMDIDC